VAHFLRFCGAGGEEISAFREETLLIPEIMGA